LPVYLGWGKHWELNDEETNDVSTSLKDVLDTFPSKNAQEFLKALEKWMPVLTLGMTLFAIAKPRFEKTRELLLAKKRQEIQNANESREETSLKGLVM
jgi:hypothetical protein